MRIKVDGCYLKYVSEIEELFAAELKNCCSRLSVKLLESPEYRSVISDLKDETKASNVLHTSNRIFEITSELLSKVTSSGGDNCPIKNFMSELVKKHIQVIYAVKGNSVVIFMLCRSMDALNNLKQLVGSDNGRLHDHMRTALQGMCDTRGRSLGDFQVTLEMNKEDFDLAADYFRTGM